MQRASSISAQWRMTATSSGLQLKGGGGLSNMVPPL
jgi:hypothetical protein